MAGISRRGLMASAVVLAGCKGPARAQAWPQLAPLRQIAPFPIGACAMTAQLADPEFARLLAANFSQLTPEWEMKMEAILQPDGGFDFTRADALAEFAAAHGIRLHGHALVWYAQKPDAFLRIDRAGKPFADAYRNYILAVAGRYRGRVCGWDVVNEAVAEDGNGYRDCLWRANLGMDYAALAFHHAREAEPDAPLFLNDYNLETNPRKRATFLKLAEAILRSGAPLGGLGTQTHVGIDLQPGAIGAAIRDLATLGLPIHVSELDISTRGGRFDTRSPADRLQRQARVVSEAIEAFMALPGRQRYAFTVWGVRDRDSWLRRPPNAGDGSDRPLLFDDDGRPKPAAGALAASLAGR